MKILWFTWKDKYHPLAGGAEVVNEEVAKRLVKDGHEIIFVVGGFEGGKKFDNIDGYKVIRVGGRFTCYWHAYRLYKKNLIGWADLIIEEVNTIPFFTNLYAKEKTHLIIHQLCREIWFYQMFFPLNLVGYLLEPVYLRLINKCPTITISESSKADILRHGFDKKKISIISMGITFPISENIDNIKKFNRFTILSLGAVREMKRTIHTLKAFEILRNSGFDSELIIAGNTDGKYGEKFLDLVKKSEYQKDIKCLGRVSLDQKIELMQKSHVITVTSVKEGWGLIVTEANSQGTPAVVYDVDALRDSVQHEKTGLVCKNNAPRCLAENISKLASDSKKYEYLRKNAWNWSKEINFDRCYDEFLEALNNK